MKTVRRALPFVLFALAALWHVNHGLEPPHVQAQGTATPYDCTFTYHFTGSTTSTGQPNASASRPCIAWRVTFSTTGFASATVQFETSPDNSTWAAVTNSICSSSVQPPCVSDGANPITAGKQGTGAYRAYGKYVRINITGVSGSGTGDVIVYGYKGTSANAGTGPGGGVPGPSGPSGPQGATGPSGAGTLAIGQPVTSGTDGSLLGVNGGNLAQDNSNLFWDFTNHRLGLGTASPTGPLRIVANNPLNAGIPVEQVVIDNRTQTGTTTQAMLGFRVWDGAAQTMCGWVGETSSTFNFAPYPNATYLESICSGGIRMLSDDPVNGSFSVYTGGYTSDDFQRLYIGAVGQVVVRGTDGTTQGLSIQETTQNSNAAKSYLPIDFYDVSTLTAQIITTASNYNSGGLINIPGRSLGILTQAAAGELLLGAGGASGNVNINAGGFDSTFTSVTLPAAGGVQVKRGGVTVTGCAGGSFIKGDGTGCGTAAGGGNSNGITTYSGLAGVSLTGATVYFPWGGGGGASATETDVELKVNAITSFSNFGARLSAALGGSNSVVLTIRQNAADTAITCTIADPAVTCSDTSHSFNSAAGDLIDVKAVFTGTIVVTPLFTFATQAGVAINGGVSTQTDVTSSRVLGTVYQNTGSSPRFVSATVHSTSGVNPSILATTDSNASPSTFVAFQFMPLTGHEQQIFFIVLPGNYYKVTVNVGAAAIDVWTEWN